MIPKAPSAGRHVFGAAALAFGVTVLLWHTYNDRDLLHEVWGGAFGMKLVNAVAAVQLAGGAALQFRRFAALGAAVLAGAYVFFAALWIPSIVAAPRTWDPWGSMFEQVSLALGAAFAYGCTSPAWKPMWNRFGCLLLGVCAVSFTLEQALHLDVTAELVPKWIPPSQMFWSIATTIAFALAAVALVTNRSTLLATRLMTAMIAGFGLIVWVPIVIASPHDKGDWGELIETFAIAGACWCFADLLVSSKRRTPRKRRAR